MASEQFILEMHKKLNPDSNIHDTEDLTGHEINVITGIIDDKHRITLSSHWIPDKVTVTLAVLRNVMTAASLNCYNRLKELKAKPAGDMTDGSGHFDPAAVIEWEESVAYYQSQLDAVKVIEEGLLDALRDATNVEGFYMRGVTTQ